MNQIKNMKTSHSYLTPYSPLWPWYNQFPQEQSNEVDDISEKQGVYYHNHHTRYIYYVLQSFHDILSFFVCTFAVFWFSSQIFFFILGIPGIPNPAAFIPFFASFSLPLGAAVATFMAIVAVGWEDEDGDEIKYMNYEICCGNIHGNRCGWLRR